jgi:hypothetical protein
MDLRARESTIRQRVKATKDPLRKMTPRMSYGGLAARYQRPLY